MMRVVILRRIADQREKLILSQAASHLEPGEEVLDWVRARPASGRGDGFVFLTERRCIISVKGRNSHESSIRWDELEGWGVIVGRSGEGPVLVLDSAPGQCAVRIQVTTQAMAERASAFVARFAALAPETVAAPVDHELGRAHPVDSVRLKPKPLSVYDHTWRVLITVLGVAMILSAILIIPLPGPWSFLLAIAGFAVLAREYDWAKDALEWIRSRYRMATEKLKARRRQASS